MNILGIDIGGSGIKGAIVDTETGELVTERYRIPTPHPATPLAIAETLAKIVDHFNYKGPVGCGFPALITNGVVQTAANIHKSWINIEVESLFSNVSNTKIFVLNDADAACLGESYFGAAKDKKGTIFLITIGTGLGTALTVNGELLANTELGHIMLPNGKKAEHFCSDTIRKSEDLSWKNWANRFSNYLEYLDFLFTPDLFVLGGGASKKFYKFEEYLPNNISVIPAKLQNMAGIIGAAQFAKSKSQQEK